MHVKGQSYVVHWTITMHVQKVNHPMGHNISSEDQSMGTRYMNLWGQDVQMQSMGTRCTASPILKEHSIKIQHK